MDAEPLPHALQIWDNAARLALPLWLKAWLGALAVTSLSSAFFWRRGTAPRVALGGFVASHLLLVVLGLAGFTIRTGLVSLAHVLCWAAIPFALWPVVRSSATGEPYGLWARALLFLIGVSLVFDVRDAVAFLYFHATGHPAL